MKKILWISGILAAIAVLFPALVVLGLFLGIVPGLILGAAPTAFLYIAAFALFRKVLRNPLRTRPGIAVTAAAATLAVVGGFVVTAPGALLGRWAFAKAIHEDVAPSQPVRLAGDVRLNWFGHSWFRLAPGGKIACDALCAALLDTPGVRSVTIASTFASGEPAQPVTYRLVPKHEVRGTPMRPAEPEKIVDYLPDRDRDTTEGPGRWKKVIEERTAIQNTITAKWSLRLADGENLVAESPRTTFDLSITLRDHPGQGVHRVSVREVVILDAHEKVLLRRQHVTARVIAMPLHLMPAGQMMERGFELGRRTLHSGSRNLEFKPVETLFRETTLARPAADDQLVLRLREAAAASAASAAPAEGAASVAPWLATLDWAHLDEKDVDVLAKLIADPRTTGLERLYGGHANKVSPRLRRPIAVRLLEPSTDDRLRNTLNTLVRNMPPGTYVELLPEEQALLNDRALRPRSSALVARLADQGARAVPMLLEILSEDVRVEPWAKRQWILADIRRAFSRLGREAASALPTVERLFNPPNSPLTNSSGDAHDWRVCMVRMGKPVESLSFPSHLGAEMIARDRERIRKQAEKGPER